MAETEVPILGSGRFPPEGMEDVGSALDALCACYARRDLIPREDLLSDIYLHLLEQTGTRSTSPAHDRKNFQEHYRALFKSLRRSVHSGIRPSHGVNLDETIKSKATSLADDDYRGRVPDRDAGEKNRRDHIFHSTTLLTKPASSGESVEEYTTEEAAAFLRVSRSYVIKLVNRGEIPARKVGRYRRILLTDLVSYRDKSYCQARSALLDLSQAVRAETDVHHDVQGGEGAFRN
jgi:excisionase family DNA binding protein